MTSSGTSTETPALPVTGIEPGRSTDPAPARRADPFEPWQLFTLAGLIGATLVVFLARGQSPAAVIVLSLVVFGAAAVGVAALRMVVPLVGRLPEESAQGLGERARAALEREKALALRSIKELEFDHAMGKVSDADYAEMSARLRARAAGLLRQLDASGVYRDLIASEIERRAASMPEPARPVQPPSPQLARPPEAEARLCAACETRNESDARFCKGCGARLETRA
jgi:hypothetical protein